MTTDDRAQELHERLDVVRARVDAACEVAGRDPSDVTLIVVSKTWPVEDVRRLAALGVRDFGENRDQEAAPKAAATGDLDLRWHFVGQLQSNKAASVARYADLVHSVDRPSLVAALERGASKAGRQLGCLLEIDLTSGATGRGGASPGDVAELADLVASCEHLTLRGVMGVAPLSDDPAGQSGVSAEAFERLAAISHDLRRDYPSAHLISAGMSEDLEEAVRIGATHLRVGSAVLGSRPPLG